jgi:Arc/MetJ family transcription regulator
MATNLSLDPDLLEKTLRMSGEKTKKAAATKALKEFVARHDQKRVAKLFGKLQWDPSFDYKRDRSRQ